MHYASYAITRVVQYMCIVIAIRVDESLHTERRLKPFLLDNRAGRFGDRRITTSIFPRESEVAVRILKQYFTFTSPGPSFCIGFHQ